MRFSAEAIIQTLRKRLSNEFQLVALLNIFENYIYNFLIIYHNKKYIEKSPINRTL